MKELTVKYGLVLLSLIAIPCWSPTAQTGKAETSGFCSPAVSGSNNQFKITCRGIDKEQAQALQRILNTILANQLDANAVMEKLEEIHKDIGVIKDRQGWAELSKTQIDALCKALNVPAKQKVSIIVPNQDENRRSLANQIRDGFRCAHWDADVNTPIYFFMPSSPTPFGIEILAKRETAAVDALGAALVGAFGSDAIRGRKQDNMSSDAISINIYYKPK